MVLLMITNIHSELNQLLIYRNILQNGVFQKMQDALTTKGYSQLRYDISCELINHAEQLGLTGNILKSYFIYLILQSNNPTLGLSLECFIKSSTALK